MRPGSSLSFLNRPQTASQRQTGSAAASPLVPEPVVVDFIPLDNTGYDQFSDARQFNVPVCL